MTSTLFLLLLALAFIWQCDILELQNQRKMREVKEFLRRREEKKGKERNLKDKEENKKKKNTLIN